MTRRTFLRALSAFSAALAVNQLSLVEAPVSPFVPGRWHAVEYRVSGTWVSLFVDGMDVTSNAAARVAFGRFVHVDHAVGAIDFGDERGSLRMALPKALPREFVLSFCVYLAPETLKMDNVALIGRTL